MSALAGSGKAELSLLPLKPGDHLWRPLPGGGVWHALYVGQYLLAPSADGASLALAPRAAPGAEAPAPSEVPEPGGEDEDEATPDDLQDGRAESPSSGSAGSPQACAGTSEPAACQLPQCVIAVLPASGGGAASIARLALADFVDCGTEGSPQGARAAEHETVVRLYTRRPRGRREAVARALGVVGARVDGAALGAFPEMLPWWAIFDEAASLQPGLCATRARAVRYKLTPRGDAPVQPAVMGAVLAGGAVVRKGRVVLRGVRLMKALRLTKAATAGWASIGGFVGQAIAASVLDDGDTGTAVATAAGGWAGGLAGGGVAAAAASTLGVEALGAGSITGGLVVCSSLSAAGAVAGAGLAYAAKKALERRQAPASDRTAEYHDCGLRLVGGAGDVFDLFDATLEFPPEDAGEGMKGVEAGQRLAAVGWYAVRVAPGDQPELEA